MKRNEEKEDEKKYKPVTQRIYIYNLLYYYVQL